MHKSALIVGASRGLGLGIVRELSHRDWSVTATVRKSGSDVLAAFGGVEIETLDITLDDEIQALKERLGNRKFDLLFVNAGIANAKGMGETVGEIARDEFSRLMETNALSPLRVLENLAGQIVKGGTLGVMSSGQGSLADNEIGGNDVYRASKAALNMLMRSFAVRHPNQALLLLAPGWIKTDMGGDGARFTVDEVIGDIVDTITAQQGKSGLRYLDRFGKSVRW